MLGLKLIHISKRGPWGPFQKLIRARKSEGFKFLTSKIVSFNVWVRYFELNSLKSFEIPHKISYLYIERGVVCWEVKIKSSQVYKLVSIFVTPPSLPPKVKPYLDKTDGWKLNCHVREILVTNSQGVMTLWPEWMSVHLTNGKSALFQVMAWFLQATRP